MRISRPLSIFGLLFCAVMSAAAQTKINFDDDKPGAPPSSFTSALTGQGRMGVWVVKADDTSPNQGHVLAQTDHDATGYRFPICVYDKITAKDGDFSVRFKAVSGERDQAAGIVWRYRDKDNYYIARANALENNVVLYKVQNGKRESLPPRGEGRSYGKKAKVPGGQWNLLRVTAVGNLFNVYLNGERLFEVEDSTFIDGGKVGVWTKGDSVTYFDDLEVKKK